MKLNSEIAIESAEVELLLTEGSTDEALDKFKDMVHATKGQMSDKFKEFIRPFSENICLCHQNLRKLPNRI